MVNESMVNTVVTSEEREHDLRQRLEQIDALQACVNAIITSKEGTLLTQEVSVLIGLSRELIEDCRSLSEGQG